VARVARRGRRRAVAVPIGVAIGMMPRVGIGIVWVGGRRRRSGATSVTVEFEVVGEDGAAGEGVGRPSPMRHGM
jgi:hypothetical protein